MTRPISTSLYLIAALPASRPSAFWKTMLMTGPCSRMDFTASQPPMSAATKGTSQTSCGFQRDLGVVAASGRADRSGWGSGIVVLHGVPDQAGIKAQCREQRQHHHAPEGHNSEAGADGCEGVELHQSHEQGDHIHIEH